MKNLPIKYSPTDATITELAQKYQGLVVTDAKSYKFVVSGIAEIRTLRVAVEKRRKELKADSITWGKKVDKEAGRIIALLVPIETDLKSVKQAEDARKKAIQDEKDQAEKERIETIQAKIAAFPPNMSSLPRLLWMAAPEIQEMQNALSAVEIDIEEYQEFVPEAIKTKHEKKVLLSGYYVARIQADSETAKQKAEADRVEQVRKDQEAKEEAFKKEQDCIETERLAKVEAQRIVDEKAKKEREIETKRQEAALKKQEEEQKAKQKIEDDRLAKIREDQEAKAQKLRDAQAEIDAQKKAIQDEKDRLEDEKLERERTEQERLAQTERDRLAKIEAEEQEKAQVEKEAQEKATREKAETEEKARQEALRPDREKIRMYIKTLATAIAAVEKPIMSTNDGSDILIYLASMIKKTITYATEQVDM